MRTAKSFEDLEVWQKARVFCQSIEPVIMSARQARDFEFQDQINMDNIAEGFGRGGNREFVNFLSYAKGSAAEAKSQLYRAFDRNYIDKVAFEKLALEITLIGQMIGALMRYLQQSEYKGPKFNRRGIPKLATQNPKPKTRNPKP